MKAHVAGIYAVFVLGLDGCSATPPPPPPPRLSRPDATDVGVASTGGVADAGGPAASQPAPMPAHVRTIHASPEAAFAHVAAYADGVPIPFLPDLAYRASSLYLEVPPGPHNVEVRPPGAAPTSQPLGSGQVPAIASGSYHTVIAHGVSGQAPGFTLTTGDDSDVAPPPGTARFRFFHAIAGVPAIDTCLAGVALPIPITTAPVPTFAEVQYGSWGTSGGELYALSPANVPLLVQFRRSAQPPCSGASLGAARITLQPNTVVTTVAIGNVGRTRVATELLVCTDFPRSAASRCTPLPIR